MRTKVVWSTATLILLAAIAGSVSSVATVGGALGAPGERTSQCNNGRPPGFHLESTIAFTNVTGLANTAEIYLVSPNGANLRRVTDNAVGDGFANLSPDGKKIVFDSDRNSGQVNVSDLFLMNADGSDQTLLTRASSATWSPDCKEIAFHASASGAGTPSRDDPGSAMSDSDIFVANVEDLLAGRAQPTNLTNSADKIDDDADWSPDGQHIVYTAHDLGDDIPDGTGYLSNSAEIYVINADGTGRIQLTHNSRQESSPTWSSDGSQIAFSCRVGVADNRFHLCVINADGTGFTQLTAGTLTDLGATWAPKGNEILFNRILPGANYQLFTIPAELNPDGSMPTPTQLTCGTTGTCPVPIGGRNLFAQWGELRVHDEH